MQKEEPKEIIMADLGKAYVQIVPSAKGISGKIEQELGGAGTGEKAGNAIGGGLVRKLAGVVAAAGIGATIVKGISAAAYVQCSSCNLQSILTRNRII